MSTKMILEDDIADAIVTLVPFEEITLSELASRAGTEKDSDFRRCVQSACQTGLVSLTDRDKIRRNVFNLSDIEALLCSLRSAQLRVQVAESKTLIVVEINDKHSFSLEVGDDQAVINFSNALVAHALAEFGRTLEL